MPQYESDIELGKEYEHIRTGIKGFATAVYFFENACERVCLQFAHEGAIKESNFDAVELKEVTTQKKAQSTRPGGVRGPSSSASARGL